MLLVACSVVTATFQFLLLLTLLIIALAFLVVQSRFGGLRDSKRTDGMLLLVVDGEVQANVRSEILRLLDTHIRRGSLQGISFSSGLSTLHYSFTSLHEDQLDKLEGGLRAIAPIKKLNVYFNNQGTLI